MNTLNKSCSFLFMSISSLSIGMADCIIRDDSGFKVIHNNHTYQVQNHDVESFLRTMNKKQYKMFLQNGGRIHVAKLNNGDYILRHKVSGLGGGPVLACLFYGATKVAAYGAFVGAAIGAVAATGGVAGAAMAAGSAVASTGVAAAGGASAAAVGAAVGSSAAATSAVGFAAGACATGTGIITAIEGASLAAGALGAAIPFF